MDQTRCQNVDESSPVLSHMNFLNTESPLPQRKCSRLRNFRTLPPESLNETDILNCKLVEASGVPNFQGCRIPLETHLNLDVWERLLSDYHDREVVQFLKFGFPINFEGYLDLQENQVVSNHRGALEFPDQIQHFLDEELSYGAILGPFDTSPFDEPCKLSPLNSVEKKDSNKRRIILDLSFPTGASVNDGIPKQQYLGETVELKFPSVDQLAALIYRKGRGCVMFKRDLKRAYRQIRVCPGDIRKLGYRWNGKIYLDKVVSMGLRSGAYICQRVTSAIKHVQERKGYDTVVYLDDFAGAEVPQRGLLAFDELGRTFVDLGVMESVDKKTPPNTIMLFIGVWFNSWKLTMEVDPAKLQRLEKELPSWLSRQKASRKEVESLVGFLGFVAKCVRPARVFLARMLDELRSMPGHGQVHLSSDFKQDVYWWVHFMPLYNGVSMIPRPFWSEVNGIIATDACLSGCGGYNFLSNEYFHAEFPANVLSENWSINELELLAVMVALKVWASQLRSERFRIHCDNTTAVAAMNLSRVRNRHIQACMREIAFVAATSEFEVLVVHVEGASNILPDLLSRWHISALHRERFYQLTSGSSASPVVIVPELFSFTGDWV